jgi:hypothetical protein
LGGKLFLFMEVEEPRRENDDGEVAVRAIARLEDSGGGLHSRPYRLFRRTAKGKWETSENAQAKNIEIPLAGSVAETEAS